MATRARLITIPFSHYCEKARWALDWTRLPYDEDAYLPGVHKFASARFHKRGTVPVLVTRHGALTDSADILKFADSHAEVERRLYPRDDAAMKEVTDLEAIFNREIGKSTRLCGYFYALPHARELADLVAPGLTSRQRAIFPWLVPVLAPLIRRQYKVDPVNAARARTTIEGIFADMSRRLEGKRYFVGDRFGAADLTFASLAAPSVLPENHPKWGSDASRLPEGLRSLVDELRATRAGEHVMRMYRDHRNG